MTSKGSIIVFKSKNPTKLAYLLRQALDLSKKFDTEHKNLKDVWKVSAQFDSVICTKKDTEDLTLVDVIKDQGQPIKEVTSIEEVVGACINYPNRALIFPNYNPTPDELIILEQWGKEQKLKFQFENKQFMARSI
jgi:hypothetical protein